MQHKSLIKPGRWTAKGGSTLLLRIAPEGSVSGLYSTAHGRPEPNEQFPVIGFINHDLIGLTCSWKQYRSMTTWCGRYAHEDGQDLIQYMWHLAREFEDPELTIKTALTFTYHTMSGTFYYQGPENE